MRLEVLASGSSGNCYLLHTSCGIIILEAGVPWKTVIKALNFDITNVICCCVTHEHMDHAKYVKEYIENGVPNVLMTDGTKEALMLKNSNVFSSGSFQSTGHIHITMFETQHDAKEPCGFHIEDFQTKEILLFATDTYYVKYHFSNVNYILVECNYAEDILQENIEKGYVSESRVKRLRESHFELSNVKEFVKANDNVNLSNVVLLHLSKQNSDPVRFKDEIGRITLAQVDVAQKGLKLDLGGIYETRKSCTGLSQH